jgi:hypothetical protein
MQIRIISNRYEPSAFVRDIHSVKIIVFVVPSFIKTKPQAKKEFANFLALLITANQKSPVERP